MQYKVLNFFKKSAFFNLFHSCAGGGLFPAYAAAARFADAGLAVARVTDRTAARSLGAEFARAVDRSFGLSLIHIWQTGPLWAAKGYETDCA